MKKRILSIVLALTMTSALLAGCGSSSSDGSGDTSAESTTSESSASDATSENADPAGTSGEVYMFISQPEYADAINTLIEEYKTVAPDVTITYETTQNDYPTMLKAKLNSGDVPDIFSSTSGKEIETYIEYSYDLTGQPLAEAMLPAVADSMKDAGGEGIYGFAIKGNYFGLVYNQELLEQVGVTEAPKTLSELKALAEKLDAAGIQAFTSGFAEWWVYKHIFQHFMGASTDNYQELVASFESGNTTLQEYPTLYDNYFEFIDLVKQYGDAKPLETDLSAELAAFASNKAAIMVGQGAWVEGDILKINPEAKILFAGYPVDDDAADCQVITGADQALRVYNDSESLDATLAFINWWYTSDYGKLWFTDVAGVVPPIATTTESTFEIIKQGQALAEADGSAPLGVIYSTDSFHTAFGEAMQAYVEGGSSKDDTVSTIEQKWQEIDGASN
ncbi:MAG: ABC transporter substrate-binding protein [Lachnospiraceae bacterium]